MHRSTYVVAVQRVMSGVALPVIAFWLTGCAPLDRGASGSASAVFFPLPPAPPRLVFLTTIDDSGVFGRSSSSMSRFLFGRAADAEVPITKPFGLAATGESLFVCDTQQNIVHVFDFKRGEYDSFGASGRGRLLKPVAVAVDDAGFRYVADALRGEVVVFSPDNQAVRALGRQEGDPCRPIDVAVRNGSLYVLNAAMHRVERLNRTTGELLDSYGQEGEQPGRFLSPSGLAVDRNGRVYVSDVLTHRVDVFDADGTAVASFGGAGDRAGKFSRPKHLAIADDGVLFVVDAGFQRIQMFDGHGRVLMLFGGPGDEPGSLTLPAGICIDRSLLPYFADRIPTGFDADYLVLVSDQFAVHKVSIYAYGRKHSGAAPLGGALQ